MLLYFSQCSTQIKRILLSTKFSQSLFSSALFRKSLSQGSLFYQSVSVCDVTLPPVGPVQLQPLLLVLGVFQLALPPQALLGLGAELSTDTDIFCRCQQSQGVFRVFFALPAAAREPLSVLVAGCFKHGQLGSRLTRTLWGGLGHRRGLRGKRCSMRGLCREVE